MCKYTQKPRVEQKICITQSGDITSEATDVGSRCAANKFAAAEACGICGCRKATVYLQIGCGQATETAMPRRYSICGKQSAAEYTQKPAQCKLVCTSNGFSQMSGPQGTLISPNRYGQATGSAMPRRYCICGKQSAAEYTRMAVGCKLVCTSNGFSQMCGPQGTHISPNRIRIRPCNGECYAEALLYMRQAERCRIQSFTSTI